MKPTQLGLGIEPAIAKAALARLGERAAEIGTTVTIDMEDSRFTEATVALFEEGQRRHGNFGIALQAYMRRTPHDLNRLEGLGGHIRLCKGAYVEPPEVAIQSKAGVDAAYSRQLARLMAIETTLPAIATHDEAMIERALDLAHKRSEPFEFQMLYGVRPDLQRRLISEGHQVRIYLPFGSHWYPYLTRRLAERPSNLWFFARSLIPRASA